MVCLVIELGRKGQNGSLSSTGSGQLDEGIGVWGDGGSVSVFNGGAYAGVMGTADDGLAGYFANDSPSGLTTLQVISLNSTSYPFYAANNSTHGYCYVDNSGDLSCSGDQERRGSH